jgi:adenine-specific DNA-methyltransferase
VLRQRRPRSCRATPCSSWRRVVDHDYDEESFFVRQAYFVGDDPYDGLKRALKAEIDETAWAELNSTVSCPFPKPESGRICVKVINHFGDEVQKVFSV